MRLGGVNRSVTFTLPFGLYARIPGHGAHVLRAGALAGGGSSGRSRWQASCPWLTLDLHALGSYRRESMGWRRGLKGTNEDVESAECGGLEAALGESRT